MERSCTSPPQQLASTWDDSAGAPPMGVVLAGRKLQIDGLSDVPGGSSKVEWLIGNRVVGEDREYTVSATPRHNQRNGHPLTTRTAVSCRKQRRHQSR